MISDFSTVLLDVRDKNILNTKPINGRTISAAKIMHVMIYMTVITGAFVAIPLLVSLVRHGIIFSIVFFIDLVFTLLFVVVLTALIYLFVLRFFDGERLKDIINYVQILLSVGVIVGYQILIQSFNVIDFDIIYSFSWWHVFIPPLWYGATFDLAMYQNFTGPLIALAVLGFVIPVIAIILYARLMPSFERNLEKLLSDTGKERKSNWLENMWATVTCRSKEERLFFRFAMTMMRKEREFKLKVYPGIGMALVFPFIFIFIQLSDRSLADISTGRTFLFIYFCNLLIPMTVHMLKFSGSYKGSWLLKAAPIENQSAAYSGTMKAFLVKLYLPVVLLLGTVFTWIFTWNVIPELVAVLLGGILQALITYRIINNETYPFSNSFEFAQETDGLKMFLLTLLTGVFVIAHLISTFINYGAYLYSAVLTDLYFCWMAYYLPEKSSKKIAGEFVN